MTLPAILLSACLAQGTVLDTSGDPIAGAAVIQAATGDTLALADGEGRFAVEAVERAPGETVLEFRHQDFFSTVQLTRCDEASLRIRLVPRVYELEPIQFSATRLARPWESSPVREESLDPEDLRDAEGGGPSLSQAVQQLPGIGAIGRDGLTSAPTIRGLGRDRSLILVEGMRIASDRGIGPTANFLDPFLLRELSVVRGASGVAYGSGAIGGVISAGLGPAPAAPAVSGKLLGVSNGRGGLIGARLGGALGSSAWRGSAGGYYRTQGDYDFAAGDDFPGGTATNSGFDVAGGALVLEREAWGGSVRLTGLGSGATDIGRPTTKPNRLDTIETQNHFLATARYTRHEDTSRTELGLGWHRPTTNNVTERFDDSGERIRTGQVRNESHDLGLSVLAERPMPRSLPGSWLGGGDLFFRGSVNADAEDQLWAGGIPGPTTAESIVSNAHRADVGGFLGWKRRLRDFGELLVAGRIDYASRGADAQPDADWVAPSVMAGAVVPVATHWAVTGQVSRSFRAPRIQELYFEGDRPGGARLASPDLVPEKAWAAEIGGRFSRGAWSAEAVTFGLLANDLIVQLPVDADADTLKNFNEEKGLFLGVELAARWKHPDDLARASVEYAYVHGENDESAPLPDIPPGEIRFTGDGRLWRLNDRDVRLRGALRAGAAKTPVPFGVEERWYSHLLGSTGIGGDEVGNPGYARLDVGLRFRPWASTTLDLAVTNALDSRYIDRADPDSYPQPGRAFRLELLWN